MGGADCGKLPLSVTEMKMRRLLAWNVMTLDGYFEGTEPWSLGFHELVWGADLEALSEQQLRDAGLLLFGRKTYEGMAAYWTQESGNPIADAMNALPKAVISNTLGRADWNNTSLLTGDATERVRELKAQTAGDVYVFGSAELLAALLRHQLVDQYRICIAPVLLGQGNPLFKRQDVSSNLKLVETRGLGNGGVLLDYRPAAA